MLPNRQNRPMAHARQLRDSLPEGPKEAQRQTRTARSSFVAMHQCVEYSPTASSSSSSSLFFSGYVFSLSLSLFIFFFFSGQQC